MYLFGFTALVEGVFLVVKHLKLVVVLLLALGFVFSFVGLFWSDAFQAGVYNPLTLAALGIVFATALTIIEWWFEEHQTNA